MEKFQFPSNGKVDPKKTGCNLRGLVNSVSIPFKRESRSKVTIGIAVTVPIRFQFPSNGKVDPKNLGR